MNSKTLVIVTGLLILSLLTNLYLLTTKGSQKSTTLSPTFSNTSNSGNFSLPISQNHQGVTSATLLYAFTGKIEKIEQFGDNTRLTLDISDSQTPQFLITKNTNILSLTSQSLQNPPSAVPISSLKEGMEISITMNYNITTKNWNTVAISIAPLSGSTPPANSPLSK